MILPNTYSQFRPTHLVKRASLMEQSLQAYAYVRESQEQAYASHCHTESVMLSGHPDNETNTSFCRDGNEDQDIL